MRTRRIASLPALSVLPLLLLLTLVAAPAVHATPPAIGEEIRVDHGFRYPYTVNYGSTASMAVSDSAVLLAWGEESGYSITGLRTDLVGGGIGDSNVVSLGVGSRFDLGNPDAFGWKIVQTGESAGLVVRNLEPRSLQTTMEREIDPPGGASLWNAEIEAAAGFHVIAWMEGSGTYNLRLARVTPELEPIGEPLTVVSGLPVSTMDLAMEDTGGLLAYVDPSSQASILLLGSDGLPELGPFNLGPARSWSPQVACCSSSLGWIVAWSGVSSLRLAFLDSGGSIVPPGVFSIEGSCWAGLGVTEGPEGVGLLAWREGDWGPLLGTRVAEGVGPLGTPFTLDDDSPYDLLGEGLEDRDLGCAWTGESFAVVWQSMHQPPVARPDVGALATRHESGLYPVRSRWLAQDGSFLYPSPRVASLRSAPVRTVVSATPSGHIAVTHDQMTDEYLHVLTLDEKGRPTGPAQRYRTPAHADDCEIFNCSLHTIGRLLLRPWGRDAGAIYAHDYYLSTEMYHWHEGWLVIDRLRDDGSLLSRYKFSLVQWEFEIKEYDAAFTSDHIFVVYTADEYGGAPAYGEAFLTGPNGVPQREWSIDAEQAMSGVAAAPLPDGSGRFLCVWVDGGGLRKAIADPAQPGDVLLGIPFATQLLGVTRGTALVAGPNQLLCVLPYDGHEVYAVRFDASGLPLDQEPILVSRLPVDPRNARGVWDGYQYLLAWESSDYPASVVYGNRMDPAGAVYDGDGFVIGSGAWSVPHLTSDDEGHVLIAYGTDRVRRIDDLGPLVEAPGGPTTIPGNVLAGARLAMNPTRGECRLAAPLPTGIAATVEVFDAAGRQLASRRIDGGASDRTLLWDGRLPDGRRAPTGAYLVRISANGTDIVRKAILLR